MSRLTPAGLCLGAALFLTPAYGLYASSIERQERFMAASQSDDGSALVNSDIALMRARFCQVLVHRDSPEQLIPTLHGQTHIQQVQNGKVVIPDGTFICAPDGSTAKAFQEGLAEKASVKESDLDRYLEILIRRGEISEEQANIGLEE